MALYLGRPCCFARVRLGQSWGNRLLRSRKQGIDEPAWRNFRVVADLPLIGANFEAPPRAASGPYSLMHKAHVGWQTFITWNPNSCISGPQRR